ncbi:MAG: Phthiocerol/phenolphthiocerol synthesis polyketide synthase type I PpsC [Rhodospirillaceae bacterium]|nr:MAG: Phthiocerol/phenolphthiocerol synthesis polyketide synthase type I PpsC [Rhodospirillaceae bacterium]
MRALVCETLGPVNSHRVQEIPDPVPGKRQVAVRVHACGVNFADTLIVQGKYQERPELPFVPGSEVAGEVIALGEGVKGIALGQRVMALTSVGGFAEIALAAADTLIPLPDGIDFTDAAAFTVAYGTSHVALETRAQLKAGETLIINGASGGVGLTALEIGKMMGATVIGLASTEEKRALVAERGADHVFDVADPELRDKVKALGGADVGYDVVGGDAFNTMLRCMKFEGRLLTVGFASGEIPQVPANLLLVKNISVVGVYWGSYARNNPSVLMKSLVQLTQWLKEGQLRPHVSVVYSLDEATKGLEALANRQSVGKVVIKP